MLVEISGCLCVTCNKYRQHYEQKYDGEYIAIDSGYCWKKHAPTRPGDFCKEYREKGNGGYIFREKTDLGGSKNASK